MSELENLLALFNQEDSLPKKEKEENLYKKLLLQKMLESTKEEDSSLSFDEIKNIIYKRYVAFNTKNNFNVGDFVQWKPGLKNKKRPRYNQPAIIMELLDHPVFDTEKDSGSPYFREPLDMVIGFLDSDNDFMLFHCDSRRFEPVKKENE